LQSIARISTPASFARRSASPKAGWVSSLGEKEIAPFYFDQLELFVGKELRPLWEGDHTLVQHARLVYDLLDQFQREGRLKKEMRLQKRPHGVRHRWYFWL